MQKIKKILSSLLILIGFILLGVAISVSIAYEFAVLDDAGAFGGGAWKLIESPIKFEHIAQANTRTIWAKTEDNKFYYKDIYCPGRSDCDQWIEIKEESIDRGEEAGSLTINKDTCIPNGIKYPRDPHGIVVECALAEKSVSVDTRYIVYYALLDDGAVWVWESSGPWYVTFDLWFIVFSPFIGLILGVVMFRSFRKYRQNKSV